MQHTELPGAGQLEFHKQDVVKKRHYITATVFRARANFTGWSTSLAHIYIAVAG